MSDPRDPYSYGSQPEGEGSEPGWGSAGEPTYPPYQPYVPPPVPPPAGHGYPPAPGGYPQQLGGHPQAYGTQPGYPPAPYGWGPGNQWSDKRKITAGLLQLLLPFVFVCGVGRLYSGHTAIGLLQLILYFVGFLFLPIAVGIWLWSVVDGIAMLAGRPVDGHGRLLRP